MVLIETSQICRPIFRVRKQYTNSDWHRGQ